LTGGAAARATVLQAIHSDGVDISNREMPVITQTNLTVAQIMSLVTGIEAYLAGLTGGSITLTPPTVPSAPSNSTSSTNATQAQGVAQPSGAEQGGAQQGSLTGGAGNGNGMGSGTTPQLNPASSSSASAIVSVLQVDGLAAKMGFQMIPADFSVSSTELDQWRIVWLKSLESGGAIINKATILGSHPYFGGGAVSGYALYKLDGDLVCSANVASYGGYVKAKDFARLVGNPAKDKTVRSIVIGGNCANNQP
jgi:hypothetical protein